MGETDPDIALPERMMRCALESTLKPEYRDPAVMADPLVPQAADLNPMDMMMLGIALKVHRANTQEAIASRTVPERRQRPPPGPVPAWVTRPRALMKQRKEKAKKPRATGKQPRKKANPTPRKRKSATGTKGKKGKTTATKRKPRGKKTT